METHLNYPSSSSQTRISESSVGFVEIKVAGPTHRIYDSIDLKQGPRISISTKSPDDSGLEATL